jgi:integrase
MPPSPTKVRAQKGSVQLRVSNRRLQLLFSHPVVSDTGEIKSKRFCVSTGYEDSLLGRQQAQVLALVPLNRINRLKRSLCKGFSDCG